MDSSYSSVTQFYVDLRDCLIQLGFPVVRVTKPEVDVVLDVGSGRFMRLRRALSSETVAIGWDFGKNPDVLAVADFDAEKLLPFAQTPEAKFDATFAWDAPHGRLTLTVIGADSTSQKKMYEATLRMSSGEYSVLQWDRLGSPYTSILKEIGAKYIAAGA